MLAAVVLVIGCGSSGIPTSPGQLNGSYQATTFTVEIQGQQKVDVLASGGSVTLTINPGLTTAGRLVIPASTGISGAPYDENLAGTYRVLGKTVIQFTALGPSFVDGYTFTSDPPELRAFVSLQAPRAGLISLVLRKQ